MVESKFSASERKQELMWNSVAKPSFDMKKGIKFL